MNRVVILFLLSIILCLVIFVTVRHVEAGLPFVRGFYGHICYSKGNVPGSVNMETAIKYASLESCENSIKK